MITLFATQFIIASIVTVIIRVRDLDRDKSAIVKKKKFAYIGNLNLLGLFFSTKGLGEIIGRLYNKENDLSINIIGFIIIMALMYFVISHISKYIYTNFFKTLN